MQLVIDIDEDTYAECKGDVYFPDTGGVLFDVVRNGTPLPKGHGRLGDLDKIKKEMQNYHDDCAKTSKYTRLGFETAVEVVNDAPTIVEADSEV